MATKVYYNTALSRPGLRTIYVAPAAIDPTARKDEWIDADGKPITLPVQFRDGAAIVDDGLARFLIAHGHARKTKPLLEAV